MVTPSGDASIPHETVAVTAASVTASPAPPTADQGPLIDEGGNADAAGDAIELGAGPAAGLAGAEMVKDSLMDSPFTERLQNLFITLALACALYWLFKRVFFPAPQYLSAGAASAESRNSASSDDRISDGNGQAVRSGATPAPAPASASAAAPGASRPAATPIVLSATQAGQHVASRCPAVEDDAPESLENIPFTKASASACASSLSKCMARVSHDPMHVLPPSLPRLGI